MYNHLFYGIRDPQLNKNKSQNILEEIAVAGRAGDDLYFLESQDLMIRNKHKLASLK